MILAFGQILKQRVSVSMSFGTGELKGPYFMLNASKLLPSYLYAFP